MKAIKAYVVGKDLRELSLYIAPMTDDEKKIVKAGCLINYNKTADSFIETVGKSTDPLFR